MIVLDEEVKPFNAVIQKEPELKNKSKIDVTKEKMFFVPSAVKFKQINPVIKPEFFLFRKLSENFYRNVNEKNFGAIRNISSVPAPANFVSIENNSSSYKKLSSFLDEINKLSDP